MLKTNKDREAVLELGSSAKANGNPERYIQGGTPGSTQSPYIISGEARGQSSCMDGQTRNEAGLQSLWVPGLVVRQSGAYPLKMMIDVANTWVGEVSGFYILV